MINPVTEGSAEVLRAKFITMGCLFLISMVVGCLPLLFSVKFDWFTKSAGPDMRSSNKFVMGLLAFGGGVLFATTFLHLLPEVNENVRILQDAGDLPEMRIYLASLIMCSGFFMMYLVEQLVHLYIDRRENRTAKRSLTRVMSIRLNGEEAAKVESHVKQAEHGNANGHSHGQHHSHLPLEVVDDGIMAALRGLLIVLALSIHELFEGLAVGLESSAANVWYMFGAVSAHKYIIAFCVGVELLAAGTRRWLSVAYIFTFSFVSALGIGIGILMVGGAGAADAGIYSVVLQGLACGTLMYVVFFEVWRQERTGLAHLACSVLGFALMVALEVLVDVSKTAA